VRCVFFCVLCICCVFVFGVYSMFVMYVVLWFVCVMSVRCVCDMFFVVCVWFVLSLCGLF